MFGLEGTAALLVNIAVVVGTTLVAGLMSGLTIGLFSIDETVVRMLLASTNETEQRQAERLLPLITRPHWLLVTLLVCNAAAVEAMPLALNQLMPAVAAVAVSVVLVLVFGEIIPQSFFVRHAAVVGAFFSLPLQFLMFLTCPVSFPVGKLLDVVVGYRQGTYFRRYELREFMRLQAEGGSVADGAEDAITGKELSIMLGALNLGEKTAVQIMTPLARVRSVVKTDLVTREVIEYIFTTGFSRVPVADGAADAIVGYCISKTLLMLMGSMTDPHTFADLPMREAQYCRTNTPLSEMYMLVQSGSAHLLVVRNEAQRAVGIVTVNDILECIHNVRFHDESDLANAQPVQLVVKQWQAQKLPLSIPSSQRCSSSLGRAPEDICEPLLTRSRQYGTAD